jgi:hypothetical protein
VEPESTTTISSAISCKDRKHRVIFLSSFKVIMETDKRAIENQLLDSKIMKPGDRKHWRYYLLIQKIM